MKTAERQRARELRAQGWSVKEIEREVGVSRASVSSWVRDVPLTAEQRQSPIRRSKLGPVIAGERSAAAARETRRSFQEEGRLLVARRSESYATGCMLYWAEGAKKRNTLKITNSDPELLVWFAAFLREHFDVGSEQMRVYCNLFADHLERQREVESYWLTRLGLPSSCLRKSIVNTYSNTA